MDLENKVYIDNRRLFKSQQNKRGLWSRAFSFNKSKLLWYLIEVKLVAEYKDGNLKTIPGTELYVYEIVESSRLKMKNLGATEIELHDVDKKIAELINAPELL